MRAGAGGIGLAAIILAADITIDPPPSSLCRSHVPRRPGGRGPAAKVFLDWGEISDLDGPSHFTPASIVGRYRYPESSCFHRWRKGSL